MQSPRIQSVLRPKTPAASQEAVRLGAQAGAVCRENALAGIP
jgi:hypothetical protein